MKHQSLKGWAASQHPLVRLYIYFLCTLLIVLIVGPVFIIVKAQYLVAGGLCLLPIIVFGALAYLARREMNRRTPPGGYKPIKGDF